MSQYKCEHFNIKELVAPDVYNERGDRAWALLDERALKTLDKLREVFGSVTVNDWAWGGAFTQSGLRTAGDEYFKKYSAHSFGRGFDCKFKHATPLEVQEYILANPDEFPYIARIENAKVTKSWLHFEVGNHAHDEIYVFYP